jgi:hypothetical protein
MILRGGYPHSRSEPYRLDFSMILRGGYPHSRSE